MGRDQRPITAAITGQIAGAHWGETAIPPHWRHRLALRSTIETFADSLIGLAPD
jgi:ADP-ribosyl-[dinitrogen reductase] hydrolase